MAVCDRRRSDFIAADYARSRRFVVARRRIAGRARVRYSLPGGVVAERDAGLSISTVLAGHSHLDALVGNRRVAELELRPLDGAEGVFVLDGPQRRDETFWERLIVEAPGRNIGFAWNGNEHNALFLFRPSPEFDFVSRHVPGLKEDVQIVPQAAIAERFRKNSLNVLETWLHRLREAGPRQLALIGGPAPKRENARLRALLAGEQFYANQIERLGSTPETIAITDSSIRLKLWRLLQDLNQETAAKFGAIYIGAPEETMDADGFLKVEYWNVDLTHANSAYGRVMLAKTLGELSP